MKRKSLPLTPCLRVLKRLVPAAVPGAIEQTIAGDALTAQGTSEDSQKLLSLKASATWSKRLSSCDIDRAGPPV
jgi:hypothetical protein